MKFKDTLFGNIPENWDVASISNITDLVTDYVANGSFASLAENVTYKNEEDEAVLIRLVDYNNDFKGDFVFINEHAYEFLAKSKLYGGEIIISNVGANVGTVFRCPKLPYKMSLAPNSIMVKFKENNDFYYFWLKSRAGQHMLRSIITGSAQPKFNKTNFRDMLVPVPPREQQDKIALVLKNLENKIELNKHINKNLEETIFSLYRETISTHDCNQVKLGDLCTFQEGYVNPPQGHVEYFDGNVKWLRAVDVNESYIINTSRTLTQAGFDSAKKSALLFEPDTIAISKSGTIGRLGLIGDFMCGNRAVINIKPNDKALLTFLYAFLKSKQTDFPELAVGSVQKNLYVSLLKPLVVKLPSNAVLTSLCMRINCYLDMIKNNCFENNTLIVLRDTLLPRLMSGEIDVGNVEV